MYTFDALTHLFFPTLEDLGSKHARWLSAADKKLGLTGMKVRRLYEDDFVAEYRHPTFLASLEDLASGPTS